MNAAKFTVSDENALAGDAGVPDTVRLVESSEYPEALLQAGAVCEICLQGEIRNVLNQPQSKSGRRNPEDHVSIRQLRGKVRLRQIAGSGIHSARDGVQAMHAAVEGAVRGLNEPGFTDWARCGGK